MPDFSSVVLSQPYRLANKIKNEPEGPNLILKGKVVGIRNGRQNDPPTTTVLEIQVAEDHFRMKSLMNNEVTIRKNF